MGSKKPHSGRLVLGAILVGLLVLLVFACTWGSEFVDWDDPDVLLRNPHIQSLGPQQVGWMFTTFYWGHYQPLVWLSYAVDYQASRLLFGDGLDPRAYHVTSSLLHAANAVLVMLLALALFARMHGTAAPGSPAAGERAGRAPRTGARADTGWALLAGLLYGLHPLRVEPVAWITGRGDLLATFFLLLAVLAYLRAASAESGRAYRARLALAVGAYALSLLSRAMGVTLPLILVLLDAYPLRRLGGGPGRWFGASAWPVWREKAPFLALAIAAAVIAPLAKAHAGSTLELSTLGVPERIALLCYGLVFYVWKTLLPLGLVPIYELRLPMNVFATRYIVSAALLALCVLALVLRRRPAGLIAGALGYAILLAPVLGVVQAGNQEVADRYSYLAGIPVALGLAGLARLAAGRLGGSGRRLLIGAAALAVALCGALSWRQCAVWADTKSLWTYTGTRATRSSIAQNGYGYVLLQQGKLPEAIGALRRAVELQPTNERAHNNLWEALRRAKRDDELHAAYLEAARVLPASPGVRFNLANELLRRGRLDEAIEQARQAVALDPGSAQAHGLLALALLQQGSLEESIDEHRRALEIDPRLLPARMNLARALERQGRVAEAIEQLRKVLELDPGNAGASRELARLTG